MKAQRYKKVDGKTCIELQLKQIEQLFDMRDPAPFIERDIDEDAAAYILSAVQEFKLTMPMRLIVYVKETFKPALSIQAVKDALHNHFHYEADLMTRKLQRTLHEGYISLIIGILFLAACLMASHLITIQAKTVLTRLIGEAFLITGWVAMWHPADIFLYTWWPIIRTRRFLRKIAAMDIAVKVLN